MKFDISWVFPALVAGWLGAGVVLNLWVGAPGLATFVFVLVGWVLSLCLHEFAHAYSAWRFGDYTIKASGYLSLNPRTYFTGASVIFPIIALVMGGIALPGGAVMIRNDLIRKPWQRSVVALAGPGATLVCAIVVYLLAVLLWPVVSVALFDALMLLAFFELMAFVLNMLPVPGLDGFAALEPWLPKRWLPRLSRQAGGILTLGLYAVVFFFGYRVIMPVMGFITGMLGIDLEPAFEGMSRFHFW